MYTIVNTENFESIWKLYLRYGNDKVQNKLRNIDWNSFVKFDEPRSGTMSRQIRRYYDIAKNISHLNKSFSNVNTIS